jgi:hypothetical protein
MTICLEKHISTFLNDKMPNFIKLQNSIKDHPQWKNNLILYHALSAVKYKIDAANMYIQILNEVFELTNGDKTFLKRAMMENIIFNLYSLLDSLAHAINQIYQSGIDFKKVQIDHYNHKKPDPKKCVRCYINSINDGLSTYFNSELPQRNKFPNHWYDDFTDYRNQIIHRTIYVLWLEPGFDYLPDYPTDLSESRFIKDDKGKQVFDPKTGKAIRSNYTKFRELRSYSKEIFDKVLGIIEKICGLLNARIKAVYFYFYFLYS